MNVAARVAEHATGGATLITGALHDSVLLSRRIQAQPVGDLVAKGVPERPPLYSLLSDTTSDTSAA